MTDKAKNDKKDQPNNSRYIWPLKVSLVLKFLLVVQNEQYRLKVSRLLATECNEVVAVSNSQEAIAHLKKHQFDLIITEVNVGQIDGWRLSRLVRTGILASSASLPIILITENYCERIAESTARMFDINRVVSYQETDLLHNIAQDVISGQDQLNVTPNVLVIEDTEDTAALVHRMLKNKYTVDLASDGKKGLQLFRQNTYDLILLDIMMPGMSGDQVLEEVIAINPNQVVIAMTAHGTIDLAQLMLVKGATDYIQKPFKADQLRKVCDIAIKREDFLVANEQFNEKAIALASEQSKYDSMSRKHYRVLDSLNSIVIELSASGRITFLNNAWFQTTKFTVSESIGVNFTDYIYNTTPQTKQYIIEAFNNLLSGKRGKETIELKIKTKRHEFVWCEFNISPHIDENNEIVGLSGTIEDINLRKKSEQQLKHIALHDNLTGINNRYFFDLELNKLANESARLKHQHSLIYIDLDHFKIINDSQGHHQGDLVLKEVARLLSERTRSSDVLCRIGGDEFAMLLTNTKVEEAKLAAKELCEVIAGTSFRFDEQVYKISCSIGISAINGLATSSETYLQQADIAMFAAKEKGRNRAHIFEVGDRVTEELQQSFEWVTKLQKALVEDDILLEFQPIIDTKSREILCYEALVRLVVDNKVVYPNEFIPSLEKAGDMALLDRHVIGKALKTLSESPELPKLAINLSAQAFTDSSLYGFIASKVEKYQVEPSNVVFELTESASLSNITGTQRLVNKLSELGCHFAIDDFGTGFSTFAYLKQIPADSVKIDGSFVKDMLTNSIDSALVKAINETAHALGKTTVAEFVEDEATLEKLAELGVNYAQGYYIGKPMSLKEIRQCLKDSNSAA